MTVSLNIENDAELRAYIKDCIRGQVTAIQREEIQEMVRETTEGKLKGLDATKIDKMLKTAITDACERIIRNDCQVSSWNINVLKPYIGEVMEKTVNKAEWINLVTKITQEAVAKVVGELIRGK